MQDFSRGVAGGEPYTLTVAGDGFVQGAVVRWNGQALATTFASAYFTERASPDFAVNGRHSSDYSHQSDAQSRTVSEQKCVRRSFGTIDQPVSPTKVTEDSPSFTLTVNGQNFTRNGSMVYWSNAARATTFVSPTQVTASIPASAITTAGSAQVSVTTVSGSSSKTSNAIAVAIEARPATTPPVTRLGEGKLTKRGLWSNTPPLTPTCCSTARRTGRTSPWSVSPSAKVSPLLTSA